MRNWRIALALGLSAGAGIAFASSGDPNDIYVTSDTNHEVYQFQRNNPWAHVPGSYAGSLGGSYSQVFSNVSQVGSIAPYLGAVAGPSQNFWIGGFGGLTEIDSTSGAFVQAVGGATARLGPAKAPNGNIMVGGPTGIEEFNSTSGAFVRTIAGVGNGFNLLTYRANEVFQTTWSSFGGSVIKRVDFTSGLPTGADINAPFAAQEIGFGPDGALYATALYEGIGTEGLWRYDFGTSSWTRWCNTDSLTGTGPHGFAFDPSNFDIYLAFQTGEIQRFDVAGNYLNQINFVPTKLTDILFKVQVPEPTSLLMLGVAGLFLTRRR